MDKIEGNIKRIFVEKKREFNNDAANLLRDLRENLGIGNLVDLRKMKRYDISGISDDEYAVARTTVLSEPPLDIVFDEVIQTAGDERPIAVRYLPGQYDQCADSAAQCIQIITRKKKPVIAAADIFILKGSLSTQEIQKIKKYLINPVDSQETTMEKPRSLEIEFTPPEPVKSVENFIDKTPAQLDQLRSSLGLAMSAGDILFCQNYFKEEEKRNPTITEIKMLDTYWSDHCRHTTFHARLEEIQFEPSPLTEPVKKAYDRYLEAYYSLYPQRKKEDDESKGGIDVCLMNLATMSMKELRAKGKLDDLEVSGEVNACSIIRDVQVNGKKEKWLIMFKNETHNHPTEIEPFGGAATCLGGAIRDPLSGRSYVYQAMRVTGSGDPNTPIEDTLPGKLPQRKITTEAAHGYSSYGNQIGVATGMVSEIYDDGYVAKRMEVGAVIAAVPQSHVTREEPVPGDIIILVGGRTGRDGIGGATGSSKEHTEESIHTAGAEVQKGNAPEERKLQRLARNPEATKLIKKSNDFGAGGVSVAIGELADGLDICLDGVPKKYEGLDGTELALSESQERMAVVLAPEDVEKFKTLAALENLEATQIATVTDSNRLKMTWRNQTIVDVSRDFIETNGVRQSARVRVGAPSEDEAFFNTLPDTLQTSFPTAESLVNANAETTQKAWLDNLKDLNTASQRGLVERFDSTVGAQTVNMPFGGYYQATPTEAMTARVPVFSGQSSTGTVMSFGFNPRLSRWSPFHGAVYSVVEAVAKIVATGGDYRTIRTSLQEYFEKLGSDPLKWGKPFSALLGAYHAHAELEIAAIGGKDSMSGTFNDISVPPTLITFAVDTVDVAKVITPEFKKTGSTVVLMKLQRDQNFLPCFDMLRKNYSAITHKINQGKILAAHTVRHGGIAAAISRMAFGNRIGFAFEEVQNIHHLFTPEYGSIILEIEATDPAAVTEVLEGIEYTVLGHTTAQPFIQLNESQIKLDAALAAWEAPLEKVFPTRIPTGSTAPAPDHRQRNPKRPAVKIARPRVVIPAFPGTNCEYDTQNAFQWAGAIVEPVVFRNLTPADIEASIQELQEKISNAQIIAIPGGFSAGDQPDGSGKFIAAVFRNPRLKEAVTNLLNQRDGLMLGICNGFQALVKLGLLPHGQISDIQPHNPTLAVNQIGRHINCMVRTKVVSTLSPWFINCEPNEIHTVPLSHGEGRFIAADGIMNLLIQKGQVATQYVDLDGTPTLQLPFNPNGSMGAVEGLTSPDGRILGKMGHSERMGTNICQNVPGPKDQKIFQSGVAYFG